MKTIHASLLAAAMALACAGAQAAVLTGATGPSANTVLDYSTAGQVAFDLDLGIADFGSTRLEFTLEEADLLGPLSLNALVRNLSGAALDNFRFGLDGITFAAAGSITPTFGTLGQTSHGADYASITFSSPEWAEFHFGNPLSEAGATDWLLSTAGLRAGDTFTITADVPEPSTAALMLSALCMSSLLTMRRRKQR